MNTLERLKIDVQGASERTVVGKVNLLAEPISTFEALIAVAEAAKSYRKAQERVLEIEGAGPGFSERLWEGHLATAQDAEEITKNKLDAALAKLEVEA